MKQLIILLLFIPLVSCGVFKKADIEEKTVEKKNSLNELNLKGKVEYVRVFTYIYFQGKEMQEKFGDIEKATPWSISEKKFNDDGNVIEATINYDDKRELNSKWKYKYDENGNKIEQTIYNAYGELTSKSKYKYDKGYEIESTSYNEEEDFYYKSEAVFDDSDKMIKKIAYRTTGRFTLKWIFKYDENGNMIEETRPNIGESYQLKYKYDENGNMIEETIYNVYGELTSKSKYKYDENGNMIEKHKNYMDISYINIYTYTYIYDKKDNWTKKITYKDNKPYEIEEREIEYY